MQLKYSLVLQESGLIAYSLDYLRDKEAAVKDTFSTKFNRLPRRHIDLVFSASSQDDEVDCGPGVAKVQLAPPARARRWFAVFSAPPALIPGPAAQAEGADVSRKESVVQFAEEDVVVSGQVRNLAATVLRDCPAGDCGPGAERVAAGGVGRGIEQVGHGWAETHLRPRPQGHSPGTARPCDRIDARPARFMHSRCGRSWPGPWLTTISSPSTASCAPSSRHPSRHHSTIRLPMLTEVRSSSGTWRAHTPATNSSRTSMARARSCCTTSTRPAAHAAWARTDGSQAYSVLDEEVGYCQGLSFISAALLLNVWRVNGCHFH